MEEISSTSMESSLPFSDAIRHGDTIYVSGQGPLDPQTGEILGATPGEQTAATLENIDRILSAGGASLADVVQATVYLTNMEHYDAVNESYAEYFSRPYPARTAVEVADLPVDIHVEITVAAAATE